MNQATQAWKELTLRGSRTVTTTFIFLECGNAAARRPYRFKASQMQEALQDSGRLIVPSFEDWNIGWTAYVNGRPGDAGIVDQISFAVMRRLGITDVFTNDRHFKAAGFNPLFKSSGPKRWHVIDASSRAGRHRPCMLISCD